MAFKPGKTRAATLENEVEIWRPVSFGGVCVNRRVGKTACQAREGWGLCFVRRCSIAPWNYRHRLCVFYVQGSRPLPREVLQFGRPSARAQAAPPTGVLWISTIRLDRIRAGRIYFHSLESILIPLMTRHEAGSVTSGFSSATGPSFASSRTT